MNDRLTTEAEVIQAIREGTWRAADKGRQRASKWYPFGQRHRRVYAGKDVEPIFAEEPDRIVVVTVYVYFNDRGEQS